MAKIEKNPLSRRPLKQFLAIGLAIGSLLACEDRDFYEELRPAPLGALNGIYREKSSQWEKTSPENDSEYRIIEGQIEWVSINEQSLQQTHVVAELVGGAGLSFELRPSADLPLLDPEGKDPRAQKIKGLFRADSKVSAERVGQNLKVTETRENHRRTTIWEKVAELPQGDVPLVSDTFQKSLMEAQKLRQARDQVLAHWGTQTLVAFERISERKGSLQQTLEITPAANLPDEVELPQEEDFEPKKVLRINRLKLTSPTQGVINDLHPAELKFEIRKNPQGVEQLYLTIESGADPSRYQATYVEGFVALDGKGIMLTQIARYDDSEHFHSVRYIPQGTTAVPTPTQPAAPTPEPDAPAPLLSEQNPETLETTTDLP